MIKSLSVDKIHIENGLLMADVKATTEKGDVGMRLAFPLKDSEELKAAVTLLENAVDEEIKMLSSGDPATAPVS